MIKKRTSIPDIKNLIEDACKSPPKRKATTPKLSRDMTMYFKATINKDSVLSTLGSAYDRYFKQTSPILLLSRCGYNLKSYPLDMSNRLYQEIGLELRKLIRVYGKKKTILSLL